MCGTYLNDRLQKPSVFSGKYTTIFYFLKEEEIYKITTALECIRYGLSQRETLQYLVQKQRRQGGNAS